jgi:ribosomal protein L7/L12
MHTQINASQFATVRETMRAGSKIEAVKLYREFTGAGLADAKEAVEMIDEGIALEALHSRFSPAASTSTPIPATINPERVNWIKEALFKGNKIEAIKLYRDGTNLGLKESKEAVEKIEDALRLQYPEKFTAKVNKGCVVMLLGLGGLLLLVALAVIRLS